MSIDVFYSGIAVTLGFATALLLLSVWIKTNDTATVTARTLMHEAEKTVTFLFDDEILLDATPKARELLGHSDDAFGSDWEKFLSLLSSRFPHLRSQMSDLAILGTKSISPEDGQPGWIKAEYWRGLSRLTLVHDLVDPAATIDPLTASAMEYELQTLRSIGEDAPQLIWKKDAEDVIVWANRAYIELSEQKFPIKGGAIRPWPPKEIFDGTPKPAGTAPIIDMLQVSLNDEPDPVWFEVTSIKRGHHTIHFGVDASAVVSARDAQHNFVQTLTKTFAQLSVGLAIFDSDRRLVLFNPAIVDLTSLQPDFLIGRPTLFSFLDRLRDEQMMPEPKNYSNWRDRMMALETAAEEGNYLETWLLPNGQTFRVTGRPHPNGAIAFLFEDISDEISLTRKFQTQINIDQAILDNLPESIAVFSATGTMILTNSSYQETWGDQVEGSLEGSDISGELEKWQNASLPSSIWVKLGEIIARGNTTETWSEQVWFDHLGEMTCHYAPLPENNHQITFKATKGSIDVANSFQTLDMENSLKASG